MRAGIDGTLSGPESDRGKEEGGGGGRGRARAPSKGRPEIVLRSTLDFEWVDDGERATIDDLRVISFW